MRLTSQALAEGSEIFAFAANVFEAANILFPPESCTAESFFRASRGDVQDERAFYEDSCAVPGDKKPRGL